MKELGGKVAVVTGAGSGIGRALAVALSRRGASVAVCDVNGDAAKETVTSIVSADGSASDHQVDVASEEQMRALVDEVLDRHGVVDVVVNNAGISPSMVATVDTCLATYRKVIDVNLWGVIHGSVLFLPHLLRRPEANLVNVASYAALMGLSKMSPYSASKFGVRGFTEALRMEYSGSALSVSLVCPGGTKTSIMANSPVVELNRRAHMQQWIDSSKLLRSPEYVAEAIVTGIQRNRPRVLIGPDTKAIDMLVRALPGSYGRLARRSFESIIGKVLG